MSVLGFPNSTSPFTFPKTFLGDKNFKNIFAFPIVSTKYSFLLSSQN
jgi:hypothetical protein